MAPTPALIATPAATGTGATLFATTTKALSFASNRVVLLVGIATLFGGYKLYKLWQIYKACLAERAARDKHRALEQQIDALPQRLFD